MAYQLELSASKRQVLQGLHNIFHVNLLRCYQTNGVDYEAPPIEIDGEEQYKAKARRKHRVIRGEIRFLVKWVRYNESENLWLTATQLDSAKQILEAYQRQNQLNSAMSIMR